MPIFVGKPEEQTQIARLRARREGSIKTDLKEIWWDGVERINLYRTKWQTFLNSVKKL